MDSSNIAKKVSPKVDLIPKWKLEEECYRTVVFKDIKTGATAKWPRIKPVDQIGYEEHFLDKIVDPETGYYYPKRDSEGKPVKTTPDNIPKHTVNTIIRLKRKDNTEVLLSKGNLTGYDGFGEPIRHYVPWPERWDKTHFNFEKDFDPKRKAIVKNCTGPGLVETIYTLEFNEANLKELFDKRESDDISFVVKDERTGIPKQVSPEPNINDTFKLFLKPFSFLYNAEYISPEMKVQYRQEAVDRGILSAAPSGTVTTTVAATPPKAGTYS
jgi:hypothetical protein